MTPTALEQLQAYSTIVADSGDIAAIMRHRPQDATTNPSLLLAAASGNQNVDIINQLRSKQGSIDELYLAFAVTIGCEILNLIPGRVSIEVDACLSFDAEATVIRAHQIIDAFDACGISSQRLLIKIAATWEGIVAAQRLEKVGIHCNLTLLFSQVQAIACADAGVTLISPFVGRITDWYKKQEGVQQYAIDADPGVQSVKSIYAYYKKHGYKTEIMAASFRSIEQVIALAGCDLLTIAPALLEQLGNTNKPVILHLDHGFAEQQGGHKQLLDEPQFRYLLNQDAMATEKLAEGIRAFDDAMQQLGAIFSSS